VTSRDLASVSSKIVFGQPLGFNVRSADEAALTMKLSIPELQGQLANQLTPLVPGQREAIRQHPLCSEQMLREAGITGELWLEAVAQHHELPGGKGYPRQLSEVAELAGLLRRADIYTAELEDSVCKRPLSFRRAPRTRHPTRVSRSLKVTATC
jgi:HD domain